MLGAWVPGASAAVVRRQAQVGVPAGTGPTGVLPGAWVDTRLRCRCYFLPGGIRWQVLSCCAAPYCCLMYYFAARFSFSAVRHCNTDCYNFQ